MRVTPAQCCIPLGFQGLGTQSLAPKEHAQSDWRGVNQISAVAEGEGQQAS